MENNEAQGAMRAILVATKHKSVFAGLVPADQDTSLPTLTLQSARAAIYFGTTEGIAELAATGPTATSKIGARAQVLVHDIIAVWSITPEARELWRFSV